MAYITRPNSWVSQDAAATTQLTYALQLNPAPLTVSIAGRDPVLGSLQFVLTNAAASAISLSSVDFTIQVGTASSDLTSTTANIGTSVSDSTNWQIQSPGTITSGPALFTLSPATGSSVSIAPGASIVVEIYNFPTVENPGNTIVNIKEAAGAIGFTSFQVTTFPSGFYFNGLSATVRSGSELIPVAQVGAGSTVTLVWNSSVVDLGSFDIYYSDAAKGQQHATPSDTGTWTSGQLTADTVFTIVVTVSVAGGSPMTASLSTSVSVQNPSIIAASITAGQAVVSGPTTLNGTLGVTGTSTVGTLNANTLGVSGVSTMAGLTVNNALSALGLATFTGGMQLGGPLAAIQDYVFIQPGNYGPAPTDGFVCGFADFPQNNGATYPFWTTIYARSNDLIQKAIATTLALFDANGNYQDQIFLSASLVLPVQKGSSFWVYTVSSPNITPSVWFYWVPLGVASSPEQMAALRLGDAEPPKQDLVTDRRG